MGAGTFGICANKVLDKALNYVTMWRSAFLMEHRRLDALDPALDLVHITLVTKKALKVLQKIIHQVFLLYKVSSSPLSNLQDLQMATWELLAPSYNSSAD